MSADDTQLYKHTSIGNVQQAKHDVIAAINDINRWSQSFKLKLNAQKSEVIWLGTRQQLDKLSQADMTLHLPDGPLISQSTVCNLGVQLDSELGFDVQARYCANSCYYHLRRISQIKRYVDQDCLRSLVQYTPLLRHGLTTVTVCTQFCAYIFDRTLSTVL